MPIASNPIGSGTVKIRSNASEGFKLSDLATSNNETVHAAIIESVWWTGTIDVARGSNTVLNLINSGAWEFVNLDDDFKTANIQLTVTSGSIVLDVKKRSSIS